MSVNCLVLAESFKTLLRHVAAPGKEREHLEDELDEIAGDGFADQFWASYNDIKRRKLGLLLYDKSAGAGASGESAAALWTDLEALMLRSRADYTLTFRAMSHVASSGNVAEALAELTRWDPFYESGDGTETPVDEPAWLRWLERYLSRIQRDGRDADERRREQDAANPRYVLRNWMAALAYEKAAEGDYSVIEELTELLRRPYEDQAPEQREKWSRRAPKWARSMPGVAFLS